jgi:HK97 family phage major capsid protein
MKILAQLRASRATAQTRLDALLELPTAEERNLNETEDVEFRAIVEELTALDERIDELAALEERRIASAAVVVEHPAVSDVVVRSEPTTYAEERHDTSYLLDLARVTLGQGPVQEARARLERNNEESRVDLERRAARGVTSRDRAGEDAFLEQRVNPSRVTGQGGELVPPLWMEDAWIAYRRAGRVVSPLFRNFDLPSGTDSINIPKVASGSTTAVQTDAGAVSSTDITSTSVQANVRTIAGQQDVALQLLDQSPISIDQILFDDLTRDYDLQLETQLLQGTGAGGLNGGQLLGFDNISSPVAVTYTSGSPTIGLLYTAALQAQSQIGTALFDESKVIFMHPRRWFWGLAAQSTTDSRPFVPAQGEVLNVFGVPAEDLPVQAYAGTFAGKPVFLSAAITTADGIGTNQDRVYVCKNDEYLLWEGALRTRVLPEVLSGTLQVRFQVFNYVAAMPHRLPKATGIITGTGLVAPSGF